MRIAIALFALLFSTTSSMSQGAHPRPPGLAQANQAEAQADKDMPPPQQTTLRVDKAKLRRDADELSSLAQSIPTDIAKVNQGMLPKDVIEKLKQIEKLSKHLRGELTR